jgi:hypothetical protein
MQQMHVQMAGTRMVELQVPNDNHTWEPDLIATAAASVAAAQTFQGAESRTSNIGEVR